jgi:hypothetical protein
MSTPCEAWRPNRSARSAISVACLCCVTACSDASHRLGGESQTTRPGEALSVFSCAPGIRLETIDDMEDGDSSIELSAGRAGFWSAFNDGTGTQIPPMLGEEFNISELKPPRGASHYAVHTSGQGFTVWGAGIGISLRVKQPYDASGYAGISFWARRGPSSSPSLRLAVPDSQTSPLAGHCETDSCHDDFGFEFELSEDFDYYSFTWEQMVARNWSATYVPSIDASQLYNIQFQVDQFNDFDFWIDDLSFLCR